MCHWVSHYIVCIGNDRPLLKDLCNHVVRVVANKYDCLGEELLGPNLAHEVGIITASYPNDVVKCSKCVLKKWLDTTEDASWNQLIKALRSPSVQLNAFASQLEQMINKSKILKFFTGLNYVANIYLRGPLPSERLNFTSNFEIPNL